LETNEFIQMHNVCQHRF